MLINLHIQYFSKLNQRLFSEFEWKIQPQENWAIVGNIGTGKSILLKILSGEEYLSKADGKIEYAPFITHKDIQYISFIDDKKWIKRADFYYQQRYYTSFTDDEITLKAFLNLEKLNTELQKTTLQMLQEYKLEACLEVPFIQLSNGQKNKSILIKALQSDYKLLLLDNPFIGIDMESRATILQLIDKLIQQNKSIIYTCNYPIFANSTTNILQLKKHQTPQPILRENFTENEPSGIKEKKIFSENPASEKIIELDEVQIKYHHKIILDKINWTVLRGEKWAVIGENGSGKSTLLSLLYADHPHTYKNKILLFNEPRQHQSIWEIKQRIGYLSSEFHLHFNEPLLVWQTIVSGFTDTLTTSRALTVLQLNSIDELLNVLKIKHLRNRLFLSLSFGEQRLVLFARAVIKQPELLILDEAYQGFDQQTIAMCNHYLSYILNPTTTLIFTSHYMDELPDCIYKYLYLANGKKIRQI